jgi:hypothetical protein
MDKKITTRNCLLVLLTLLVLAAVMFVGFRYITLRVKAGIPIPIVLIHRPYNHQEVSLEKGIAIHATARAEDGISRMELWVDGKFITAQEAPESGPISPLILHDNWQPIGGGTHEVIIRAYDGKDIEGIGSVIVTAVSTGTPPETGFDPFAGFPDSSDSTEDTGEDSGDGVAPSDSAGSSPPPSDSGGARPAEVPAEEGAPPADDTPPPPSLQPVEFTLLSIFDLLLGRDDEGLDLSSNNMLELEAISLITDRAYEGVHCYIGLGDSTPRWYPDNDFDQSTDDNFSMIEPGRWNVEDSISYSTYWDVSQPAPFTVTCVAHSSDTESVDLGHVEIIVEPSEFDGVTRSITASNEGSFAFAYRITQGSLTEKGPSSDIPIPYNLRINDRREELEWDWDPEEEGVSDGVAGFMIFVNDILIFNVADWTSRAVRIPNVWFSPPCRTKYDFTIRAYKAPYPDNDYSLASDPVSIPDPDDPPRTDCQPEFVVEFQTLKTGEFSGVGPVSGYFFANDQYVSFQGVDMQPNRTYNLPELILSTSGELSSFTIEPQPGENIRIGFDLALYRGMDILDFCTIAMYHDYDFNKLMSYGYFEETLYSEEDDGRKCQITYTIRPLSGSPFGSGHPDFVPLPWLDVVGFELGEEGNLIVSVRNTGSATWANQDLWIDIDNRVESWHSIYLEREFVLEVGETKEIITNISGRNLSQLCVILDPDNLVLELYESTGALYHATTPYCRPRPDLRITDVNYDFDTNTLLVHLWNTGELGDTMGTSDFDVADLMIKIESTTTTDEHTLGPDFFGDAVIRRGGDMWFEIPIRPSTRAWMDHGYTVIIDPEDMVHETNEDNNQFEIRGGEIVRVVWNGMYLKWYPNRLQDCTNDGAWRSNPVEVNVSVNVRTDYSDQRITSWSWDGRVYDEDVHLDEDLYLGYSGYPWNPESRQAEFFVRGEEDIHISVSGEQSTHSMGSATGILYSEMNWFAPIRKIQSGSACVVTDMGEYSRGRGIPISVFPTRDTFAGCRNPWLVYIAVCTVSE